jgi:hypothetical protein
MNQTALQKVHCPEGIQDAIEHPQEMASLYDKKPFVIHG